ncbi:hypothetical protein SLE2022_160210 [Rubroshorea leprosula]
MMNNGTSGVVPLPQSVEELIQKICLAQKQPPLLATTRLLLESVGETAALCMLQDIDSRVEFKRPFDEIVVWMINNYLANEGPPPKRLSPSSQPQNCSPLTPPGRSVCLMTNSQDETVAISASQVGYSSPQQHHLPRSPVTPRCRTLRLMTNSQDTGASSQVFEQPATDPVDYGSPQGHHPQNRSLHTAPCRYRTVRLMMNSQDDTVRRSLVLDQQRTSAPPDNSVVEMLGVTEERFSPQMMALGELEFRKAFLILNYIGLKKLEEAISSADWIRKLKDLAMVDFETEVWKRLGQNVNDSHRCKYLDWDCAKTYLYHCHVSQDGNLRFEGPYLDATRTHLQRVLGDDNVLIVKFAEDGYDWKSFPRNYYPPAYHKILKEGIPVGLRRYRFFVFKDGGKKAKKKEENISSVRCLFVRMESNASLDKNQEYLLSGKTVQEARSVFMHVHTLPNVPKYMARLSLILSKTVKLQINLADVTVQRIADIPCLDENGNCVYDKDGNLCIHTDGTGFISEDLALKCPKNVVHGSYHNKETTEVTILNMIRPDAHFMEPPLLIQFRLFHNGSAAKGTLLVNKKLRHGTILLRDSMIKVNPDPKSSIFTNNSLEVVATSNRPRRVSLSRYLIALLSCGGVPKDFFMDALKNALEDAQSAFTNKRAAFRVSLNRGSMDGLNAARMISSGIPLDESFLQNQLFIMSKEEKKGLKGGKIPVNDCYYLMGTADPTGILEKGEVCIILDNGQISGKVLVYRHPGLHFGDIHLLNARYVKELEDFVGQAKYAIFFPCKGPRSLSDQMAGGDLDGDMYFVSRNSQLLHYFEESSDRWTSKSSPLSVSYKKQGELSDGELEEELHQLFLRSTFQPSSSIGVAADSWMAIMDRYLTLEDSNLTEKAHMKENILRLIDIYCDALDAPKKSGEQIEVPEELRVKVFPHYMEKKENSYKSTSILGKIFDFVESYGEEKFSQKEIRKLPSFMVNTPEVEAFKEKWKELYENYRKDMSNALNHSGKERNDAADEVINYYKQLLYGAAEFEESKRPLREIYDEALAIYNVTYDYAIEKREVKRCGFAWKVAGSALSKLYTSELGEKPLCCAPSVLKELFS